MLRRCGLLAAARPNPWLAPRPLQSSPLARLAIRLAPRRTASLGRVPVHRVPASEVSAPFASPVPASHLPIPHSTIKPTIWRPLLFCTVLSLGGFAVAAEMTNYDTAKWRALLQDRSIGLFHRSVEPTDAQLSVTRRTGELQEFKNSVGSQLPRPLAILANWWYRMPDGKQTAVMIIGVNACVFLAWQVPNAGLRRHMIQHWMHYPLSGRSHTILTSTFSHSEVWHFGFNMVAMYSLASVWQNYLHRSVRGAFDPEGPRVPESTGRYHFLSFLLAAGLFSGFATHAYSLLVRAPRLLRWKQGLLPSSKPPQPILPSLGISGAAYACLTGTALAFPDAQVSLIFLPMIPFSIGPATCGVVLLDLVGLVRGWRLFDHAAHLGGALIGVLWYAFVPRSFDRLRLWSWDDAARRAEEARDRRRRSQE